MTRTYYQRDTSRAAGWTIGSHENAFELTTASPITQVVTALIGDAAFVGWTFLTPVGEPNDGDWPNGTYRVQMDITTTNGEAFITPVLDRVSADGATTLQILGNQTFTGTGLKLTSISINPSAGSTGDRFGVEIDVDNSAASADENLTLQFNTVNSFADGPWTASPSGARTLRILWGVSPTQRAR